MVQAEEEEEEEEVTIHEQGHRAERPTEEIAYLERGKTSIKSRHVSLARLGSLRPLQHLKSPRNSCLFDVHDVRIVSNHIVTQSYGFTT